ncbi:multiple epidermal growth factor-like domains protein 10 [Argopecten irradians]|uniref:multiple epidermal growth factor-like domains protein 10 n=1 Tax=Argopecten irradians TaxID=31199 RepID=UPI0037164F2F
MINITYRHHDARRLQGYSLYVTNNTDMTRPDGSINEQDGHLCYHDNGSGLPTFNQTRQCHVKGRYVVFYNIRSNREDALIELCEVQVYGCPFGQFGYNCGGTCHCMTGGCDPDTGQCDVKGCQTGWMGLSCSLQCHCDGGVACDIDTGACPGGRCQSGWSGQSCFVSRRNLAYGKPTRQSTTYSIYGAYKAVDGVISKDFEPPGSCTHTDPNGRHPEAWWQVDLGTVQLIRTINIVYRQLYNFRMSGFYLYVSNSSVAHNIYQVLSKAHLCYHDHGPGLPSYIQSLSCPVSGRYVIFYNKRPADYEPKDVKYYIKTSAVIELCEVQVLGECPPGRKGISCDQACTSYTFGRDCTQTCHCANSDCDRRTGVCKVPGCTEEWKGQTCSQACINHTFGQDCTHTCHCANSDCDGRTGVCKVPGCMEGWDGRTCSQVCTYHTFGRYCAQTCHCANSDCDGRTGICKVPGCMEGWEGRTCSQACTYHTFGRDCVQTCHCANSDCDWRTGICNVPGCMEGWEGRTCSQVCTNHTFGRDCNKTCHCANSDCDARTGICNVPGCMEGWEGRTCSQALPITHSRLKLKTYCVIVLTLTVTVILCKGQSCEMYIRMYYRIRHVKLDLRHPVPITSFTDETPVPITHSDETVNQTCHCANSDCDGKGLVACKSTPDTCTNHHISDETDCSQDLSLCSTLTVTGKGWCMLNYPDVWRNGRMVKSVPITHFGTSTVAQSCPLC